MPLTLASSPHCHLNSWLIGIRKVFANFTSVVRRRSFSPRSMAPVNDRARPPWCASASCVHFFFSRSARTRLPSCFLTAVAFVIHHTIRLPLKHRQRSVVGPSIAGHRLRPCSFFICDIKLLQSLQIFYVHDNAALLLPCYEIRTRRIIMPRVRAFSRMVRCINSAWSEVIPTFTSRIRGV